MKPSFFASLALCTLEAVAWRRPSCCPYCPTSEGHHWIRWGFYPRWGEGEKERLAIQRYRCRITKRTFSLLPDSLLPYHYFSTGRLLQWLHTIFVGAIALGTLARRESIGRSTLQHLRRCFLGVIGKLRLPGRPAALAPPAFLELLADMKSAALGDLFADWKELEPKHAVVGIYSR